MKINLRRATNMRLASAYGDQDVMAICQASPARKHVYYNEFHPHAAETLRELIKAGRIPDGEVDVRDVKDVSPSDLRGFSQVHLFAGIAGWALGLKLAGAEDLPVWTFSCPCQPFSNAGARRGTEDPRHLWPVVSRLVQECLPPLVFGEQVEAAIRFGWWDDVAADLEGCGYTAEAAVLPACSVGALHQRSRLYFVAHSHLLRHAPDFPAAWRRPPRAGLERSFWSDAECVSAPDGKRRGVKPGLPLMVDGFPGYVECLRGSGNAIVPQQAAQFVAAALEDIYGLE